jgi:hypothetical protein
MHLLSTTEGAVRRELLQLSLRNAARSVPALLIVMAFVGMLGAGSGQTAAAAATVALGVAAAAWRLALLPQMKKGRASGESGLRRLERSLECNAALSGAAWVVSALFIYPRLEGSSAIAYMVMVCGSVAVGAQFLSLVRRSFEWLAGPQLAAIVLVTLHGGTEPRDPHSHERSHRHDRSAGTRHRRRASRRCGTHDARVGGSPAGHHRRHPRLFQDRSRPARSGAGTGAFG